MKQWQKHILWSVGVAGAVLVLALILNRPISLELGVKGSSWDGHVRVQAGEKP